jgi:hypothetical protein
MQTGSDVKAEMKAEDEGREGVVQCRERWCKMLRGCWCDVICYDKV